MQQGNPFEELIRSLERSLQGGATASGRQEAAEGGGENAPPPPHDGQPAGRRRTWGWLLWGAILAIFFLGSRIIDFLSTLVWFNSVGFEQVFWTRLLVMAALFLASALLFLVLYLLNLMLARQLSPWGLSEGPMWALAQGFGLRIMPVLTWVGVAFAIVMGMAAMGQWEQWLLFRNQIPFGSTDPLFGREVGFFVFTLPVWSFVRTWLMVALTTTAVAVALVNGVLWQPRALSRAALAHLAILIAAIFLVVAWEYRLYAWELVYSERGLLFGAGFADAQAVLPAARMMVWLAVAAAAAVLVAPFVRRHALLIAGSATGLLVVAWAVGIAAYPAFVQRFQVGPNQLSLERPWLAANIAMTREAFALDEIETRSFSASTRLTAQAILQQPETLLNIRLWDYRPLLQTYNQVQALRQYYEFTDVDIDRYTVDGNRRQLMLSARELRTERLSPDAQTWVNQRLIYTHGFGIAASPVAQVTRDGLPTFYVKDLPPTGVITVTVPQLYFGELLSDYVVAATEQPEFSYPRETGNVTTRFSAETGINMTWPNRLLFALQLADLNLILSRDISRESQLLWQRQVAERVRLVAPFLTFDEDPYIVVDDSGRLFWMHDAFTTTDRYPYSQPKNGINYIRNSVKVVTNAYDGTMIFYVVDEEDPILAAYRSAFPTLFRPLAEMPADQLDNIRYPEDLFSIQADVFRTYHMVDVDEFYNREDLWAWPEEIVADAPARVEPYYVLMQLPGSRDLDYVMIMPYTPSNRENMVAWLAVQNDPAKYGEKIVFNFGKDSLLFGPKQVEARINQDPVISAQLTLWNQLGSNVIRGNMMVMPIADSLLYVEPIYLQAATGRIPELQRVVVATADDVVMGENLGVALADLFQLDRQRARVLVELGSTGALPEGAAGPEGELPAPEIVTTEELILRANTIFDQAQQALRSGDFAGYGSRVAELQQVLRALAAEEEVELPSPTPEPAPSAPSVATPPAGAPVDVPDETEAP